MKINKYLPLAVAAIAMTASNSAFAGMAEPDPAYYGSASRASISITVSTQDQGDAIIFDGPSNGTVNVNPLVVFRVGNREILQILLESHGEDMGYTIEGWSIQYVKGPYSDPNEAGDFFITKTGYEPIYIGDLLNIDGEDFAHWPTGGTYEGKTVNKSSQSESKSTSNFSSNNFSTLWFSPYGEPIFAFGNLKHQLSYFTYQKDKNSTSVMSLNSFSLNPATGSVFYSEQTAEIGHGYLVQASVTGGKGVPFYYNGVL